MSQDSQLRQSVLAEFTWEPSVTAGHIGVTASAGVVTRSGQVDSYAKKHAAGTATRRVKGVKAVAEEIEVRLPFDTQRSDEDIAAAAIQGISTRSVNDLMKAMGMDGISKSQVSRLCGEIDERVNAFLARPIEGDWPYVWLDATYVKVRRDQQIVSAAVIIAVGVNTDGRREVLGMTTGHSEGEPFLGPRVYAEYVLPRTRRAGYGRQMGAETRGSRLARLDSLNHAIDDLP